VRSRATTAVSRVRSWAGSGCRVAAPPSTAGLSGREVAGVPLGLADGSLALVGLVLLLTGIGLHLLAAARRRRADRDFSPRPAVPVAPARAAQCG